MKGKLLPARLISGLVLLAGFDLLVGAGGASPAAAQEGSGLLVTVKEGFPEDIAATAYSFTAFTLSIEPEASCWQWPPEPGGSFHLKAESSTAYGVAYIRNPFVTFGDFPLDVEFSYNMDLTTPAPDVFPISAVLTVTASYCPPGSRILVGSGCTSGSQDFDGGLCVATRQVMILPPEGHSTIRGDVRIDFQNDQDRDGVLADGESRAVLLVDINETASCWGEPVDRMGHFSMKASTTLGSISPRVAEVESWPIPIELSAGRETGEAEVSIEFTYCPPDAVAVAGVCTDPNAGWRWNSCKGTVVVPFLEPPVPEEEKPQEGESEPPREPPKEGETEMEAPGSEEETAKNAAPAGSAASEEGEAGRRTVAELASELEQFLGVAGAKDPDLARAAAGSAGIGALVLIWVVMNRQSGVEEEDLFEAVRKWRWGDAGEPPAPPPDVPEADKELSPPPSTPPKDVPEADKVPVRKSASPGADLAVLDLARKARPDEAPPPRPPGSGVDAKAWRDAVDINFSADEAPPRIEVPPEVISKLGQAFQRTVDHGTPNEVGGILAQKKDGSFTLTQETQDEGLAHTVRSTPPAAADPQPVGYYHTHAFAPDAQGDAVDIAPSDGDFIHLFKTNTRVEIVQTGGNRQWLVASTSDTPPSHEVNGQEISELFERTYNEAQAQQAGYEEGVRRAAIEVANRYKLKLYTGQNGKLSLVNP